MPARCNAKPLRGAVGLQRWVLRRTSGAVFGRVDRHESDTARTMLGSLPRPLPAIQPPTKEGGPSQGLLLRSGGCCLP